MTITKANSKVGDGDEYTTIEKIWNIDPGNKSEVMETINDFCGEFAHAELEHTLVISADGKVYQPKGTTTTVNPGVLDRNILNGSIGVHNHPVQAGETMNDSFSRMDLLFSAEYKTGTEYLVSGTRRNAFRLTANFSVDEIYAEWGSAFDEVRKEAFVNKRTIVNEQEEIMKILSKRLKGFEFYEDF